MAIDLKRICDDMTAGLWSATKHDWTLNINHCLTEPTCPTAYVAPEGWHIARYRVDCDTLEESLHKCLDLVKREVIDRQVLGSYAPYTNPDDDLFAKWLYERAAGSDEPLPHVPPRALPETFEWVVDGFLKKHAEALSRIMARDRSGVSYIAARIRHLIREDRYDYKEACRIIGEKIAAMGTPPDMGREQPRG